MSADAIHPIVCRGVSQRFGRIHALEGVSLIVETGAVYALLGRNGAGKSTLVRGLLGHQQPQSGSLEIFGADAWKARATTMTRVGVVPEDPDAPPGMTAGELEAFCGRLYGTWEAAEVRARLSRAGIPLNVPFGRLSRGQKAQVALALALGHHPELLILDDPTLGLDAVARRTFYGELVADLAERGTTVLLTTHDLAGIEGIASHVGILRQGKLVLDEPMEVLKARFRVLRSAGADLLDADLAQLEPLRTERQPWGTEALVSRFDPGHLEALQARTPSVLEAHPLSLEELFVTLAEPEVLS